MHTAPANPQQAEGGREGGRELKGGRMFRQTDVHVYVYVTTDS